MGPRPEIFVSAVVPEMNAYRKAVKQALLEIGARPVEHTDFSIEYAALHGVLSGTIRRCEAVIHLAGCHYGMEPAERTLHAPRRSFAQYELDVARFLDKPIYVFATAAGCKGEEHKWEDDARLVLQSQHRAALERGANFATFSSYEELGRQVRLLRGKLVVCRSLARLPARPMEGRFIGRQRLLQEIAEKIEPGRVEMLHPAPDAHSTGGLGTSCLAIELGWRLHDERRFDYVFWVPAGPRADLEVHLAALARADALALLPDEVVSHRARFQAVRRWFEEDEHAGRWLVIFDGVDDEIAWWSLRPLLPGLSKGAVIITGRPATWPELREHPIGAFSPEPARQFMQSRLGQPGQTTPPAEQQAWDRLAEALGRLPLAMEVAAAHLRAHKQSAREFLSSWTSTHKLPSASQLPTPVAMIEHAVASLERPVRAFLSTLCCLAGQPFVVPVALFEHRGDWPQNSLAIAKLARRGLLTHDEAGQAIALHRLVREIVRDRLSTDEMATALGAARAEVDALLLRPPGSLGAREAMIREQIIPHCRALMGQMIGHPVELHAVGVAQALGTWLKNCGRLAEAETFYRRALAIEERRLGPKHADLAPRLRDLATLLRSLRRLPEAEEIYRRLVALHESAARPDAAAMSADLTQFAATLRVDNRLADAEGLCRQALDLARRGVGPQHPKTALAAHHLAGVLEAEHRPREAERLYREALEIEERAFGFDHPRLASRLYHLALSLHAQGRLDEAELHFRRGLAIDEEQLGPESADLAPVLSELAGLLEDQGQLAAAEPLYRRALKMHEKADGPDHSETALAASNLGQLLEARGELEAARSLYEQTAATLFAQTRRLRGPHPHLRSALQNLARVMSQLGWSEWEVKAEVTKYEPLILKRERSKWEEEI